MYLSKYTIYLSINLYFSNRFTIIKRRGRYKNVFYRIFADKEKYIFFFSFPTFLKFYGKKTLGYGISFISHSFYITDITSQNLQLDIKCPLITHTYHKTVTQVSRGVSELVAGKISTKHFVK